MTATRYWHIAHPDYQEGDDLQCRNQLAQEGRAPQWHWDDADEGFDGDVVCLFPDTADGRRDADWYWSDADRYTLLAVDVPAGTAMVHVEEGYPAIVGRIPAAWITAVRSGYQGSCIVAFERDAEAEAREWQALT